MLPNPLKRPSTARAPVPKISLRKANLRLYWSKRRGQPSIALCPCLLGRCSPAHGSGASALACSGARLDGIVRSDTLLFSD
eukprot:601472-Amorphochlora_amoeboformis.AAC.1